ncbi:uncharacterized protein LOC119833386 isoform X1 [Zerene cesonia]|uniref:uncharacterized protein LOC119833386 isoform X1 n=1 Tax=Zerene cesonia TaxID=33412 RepID=UPI0018E4DB48|nr:uncharacterized protein LOC119833386 isoform X1 [Zerene cesonia]
MTKCSVKNCPNNTISKLKKDGVSYFSFPHNPVRCSKWAAIIGTARGEEFYKPRKGSVVCSDHFPQSDIYTTIKGYRRLVRSAKPTLLLKDNNRSNVNNIKQEPIQTDEGIISGHHMSHADQESVLCGESSYQRLHQDKNLEKLQQSPSSSLSNGSILDTPREVFMKKKINLLEKRIIDKNKKIDRLQKQNKRLAKKNITLKNALSIFNKSGKFFESKLKTQNKGHLFNKLLTLYFQGN